MQKITPCLWFDNNAEEAVNFYISIFKDSKILNTMYYGEGGHMPVGAVLSITFELNGQEFISLNGGPHYKFTPAISMFVKCESQQEVDHYWEHLMKDGREERCGWLTDKYGVSWQVVPTVLGEMLRDKDPERAKRVMNAMLQMVKLDIAALKNAYDG